MVEPVETPIQTRIFPLWAHRLKRAMPRGLFGRTLLIIVMPTLLALCVATFVFFDRHWLTVTHRLTNAVAGDVASVVELMRQSKSPDDRAEIVRLADSKMELYVSYSAGEHLSRHAAHRLNPLRDMLQDALDERVQYPHSIDMRHAPETIAIRVETPEGVYTILTPQRRIYTPTTEVFIGWMVGSSILLSVIALLFMRNQVRPIRRLAEAASSIGKGHDVPWFKPEGAAEVRQAAAAVLVMRDRMRRQITQRTAMLAGVSHDLRTPLTRMKLQLALMPETDATREFSADISEMEGMVEAYLAFARGEEAEAAVEVDLPALLEEIVAPLRRQHPDITVNVRHIPSPQPLSPPRGGEGLDRSGVESSSSLQCGGSPSPPLGGERGWGEGGLIVTLRRAAMKRCIANLVGNAARYGKKVQVGIVMRDHSVDIVIDDDGPGIAPERREDVFRPFLRLDESRNPGTGGVGLGMTIARDIARFHGGDVVLEDCPLGGLRARVWLPI